MPVVLLLFGIITYAAPVFYWGLLLQLLFVGQLGWFPVGGAASPQTIFLVEDRTHILLLDDVSSELDPERSSLLFATLAAEAGQCVLTTTAPDFIRLPADAATFFRGAVGAVAAQTPAGALGPNQAAIFAFMNTLAPTAADISSVVSNNGSLTALSALDLADIDPIREHCQLACSTDQPFAQIQITLDSEPLCDRRAERRVITTEVERAAREVSGASG